MKLFIKHIILFCAFIHENNLQAQSLLNASSIQYGIGSSTLLGDLGGSNGIGNNFIGDFDVQSIRGSLSISTDWALKNNLEYRTSLNYIFLSASDKYSGEYSRKMRNLSVNTSVVEFTPAFKFNFFNTQKRSKKMWKQNNFSTFYLTAGAGIIYFNTIGEFDGRYYSLKKLSTEGQGLNGGPKKYSNLSLVIPVGLGFSRDLNRKSSVFFEFTARKCFTDYLDDVSNKYYDNESLAAAKGDAAATLADRNVSGNKNKPGAKRGNPGRNDSYFTFVIGYRMALNWLDKRRI